jgi:hypothetical protein
MASFVTARRTGNLAALVGRLHPLTIQRYGSTQCRKAVAGLVDRTLTLKVTDVDPPSVFNYDTDGKHVALPDVIGIHTTGTARGQSVTLVTHALAVGGRYYVFADCGTPIS